MRVRAITVAGSPATARTRAALALVPALTLCTVIAGCGGNSDSATGTSPTPAAPTVSATVTPTATATSTRSVVPGTRPAPTSRTTGGGSAPVTASSFRADLTVQRAGLGLLALTNTSGRPVTVQGWATLQFLNAANQTVAVPLRKVAVPGAGPSITIGPGQTAFAGVRWTVGDKADPKTFVATTLRLMPPGGTGWANVNVIGVNGDEDGYPEFDLTGAEIGTLQPSSQGVLVF